MAINKDFNSPKGLTKEEILLFIASNENEKLQDYYDKIAIKMKESNDRSNKINLILIIIAFTNFIDVNKTFDSFSFGPIGIKDIDLLIRIRPIIFFYYFLEYVLIDGQRNELRVMLKIISLKLYNQELLNDSFKFTKYNSFSRLVMPFSISNEISTVIPTTPLGALLFLPLFIIMKIVVLFPFFYWYISFKILADFYTNDLIAMSSFVIATSFFILSLYYILRVNKSILEK